MSLSRTFESPRRYSLLLICLVAFLIFSSLLSVGQGASSIAFSVVWQVIYSHATGSISEAAMSNDHIVWLIRAPRVLLGAVAGAGLAIVGTGLQAVTRNPLADPHLLGATSGATLGAVLAVLYIGAGVGSLTLPLAAFLGAFVSLLLVLSVASKNGRVDSERLLLSGVAVSFVVMAAANLLLFLGDHRASSSILFWMMGGLGLARWDLLWVPVCVVVLGGVTMWIFSRSLNALMAGEQTAVSLGFDTSRIRLYIFVTASLITGTLVALTGSIGFVGLMIPHIARRLVGAEHRRLLPICALLGAIFIVWVDVIARTLIAPQDLPIGVATAAIGGVFFIALLRKR